MNSKYALLAIPLAALLGSVLFLGSNDNGETIQVDVFEGLGLFLLGETPKSSGLLVTGAYDLILKDEFGNIKSHTHKDNLVVDIGLQTVADQMFPNIDLNSSTQAQFSYLEIGTSATAVNGLQTVLQASACARVQDTLVTGSFASNTATVVVDASFSGATCAGTIEEVGLFNAATGGQMLSRTLTGSTVVGSGDTLDVTYTFTIKDDGV